MTTTTTLDAIPTVDEVSDYLSGRADLGEVTLCQQVDATPEGVGVRFGAIGEGECRGFFWYDEDGDICGEWLGESLGNWWVD